jgi:hypothetical protein
MIFEELFALGLNCPRVLPPTKKMYDVQIMSPPKTIKVLLLGAISL